MKTEILFSNDALNTIDNGINKLANTVKVTIGAKGRNVLIQREHLDPLITNDGVTIVKAINLENEYENMAAQLVKDVAIRTNKKAGDGTTTAILLVQALWNQLYPVLGQYNPMVVKNGLKNAMEIALKELDKMSVPIETNKQIERVATISGNNDSEIGELIAKAVDQIGEKGVILLEEANQYDTTLEIKMGLSFEQGFISPYLVNNEKEVNYEDALILATDKKIESMPPILNVLSSVSNNGEKIVIICDDMSDNVLSQLITSKMQGKLDVLVAKCPGFGQRKEELIEDIAAATGANPILKKYHTGDVSYSDLGMADVKMTNDSTTLINDSIIKTDYINNLKVKLEDETAEFLKDKLRERISKLESGIALIKVGADTETEANEKELRIEDAINATKAAIEDGILPGGGVALYDVSTILRKMPNEARGNADETVGFNALSYAIEEPLNQIHKNAGISSDYQRKIGQGKDVLSGNIVTMTEAGIIDPTKVTKSALENAVSVISMLITTDVSMILKKCDKA